jgi:glycosyltransferase involved in cell wall biosynthesis
MSAGPLVSVVIPVKNGARFMREAIDSVLAQRYPRLELLIVDGGSTDGSIEIARSYEQATLLPQRGDGLGGAWNEGIEASSGELVALLDSDDRWLPGKLEAQVAMLRADPRLGGAIGRVRHFLEPGYSPPPGFQVELLDADYVAPMPGALLARRSVFDAVGLFDTSYDIAIDVDWFARVKDAGIQLGVVQAVVIEKRVHDTNLSLSDVRHNNQELLRVLRDSVARQRSGR